MYFLLKMVTFQPAMLVYQRVFYVYDVRIFTKSGASTLYNSNVLFFFKGPWFQFRIFKIANLILLPSPILIVISDDGYDMAPYYKG